MSNKTFTKGKANQRSLADRMKTYEEVTTNNSLIEKLPIYARLDMRAGHSFCRGLEKPFDDVYGNAMKEATKYLVEKTGAVLGYTQSDEISLVWKDHTKVPFETRLFKLESVFASMCTAAFMKACMGTKLEEKVMRMLPSFDCRILNLPSLDEAANMILWRVQDSVKNSITLLSLAYFSDKEILRKNGNEKIQMLRGINIDYYRALREDQRFGAFFRRELFKKELTDDEINRIPINNRPPADEDGKTRVTRSHVVQFDLGTDLNLIGNKVGVLFNNEMALQNEYSVSKY